MGNVFTSSRVKKNYFLKRKYAINAQHTRTQEAGKPPKFHILTKDEAKPIIDEHQKNEAEEEKQKEKERKEKSKSG